MQSDSEQSQTTALSEADELRQQLVVVEDKWRRTAADLANLQKRFRREVERGELVERERVLGPWLDIIDDLERALAHAENDVVDPALVQGVRAVASRAANTVAGFGYPRNGAVGEVFDPALHEVISTVTPTDEIGADVIASVVKAGYGTAGHLLRPATVVVAEGPD